MTSFLERVRYDYELCPIGWKSSYLLLPRLINQYNLKYGAEIGVAFGGHCESILKNTKIKKLYGIDSYKNYSDYDDPLNLPQIEFENIYKYAQKRLAFHKSRFTLIRKFSSEAIKDINHKLDFAYIDANHSYLNCLKDLIVWYPKIRHYGVVSGHDYSSSLFPGVTLAVNHFFSFLGLEINYEKTGFWWIKKNETYSVREKFIYLHYYFLVFLFYLKRFLSNLFKKNLPKLILYTLRTTAHTIKVRSANLCIRFRQPLTIDINNAFDCEIRMVVCHKDVYLAINSIMSFYKHFNLYLPLYVHDDGSLTSSDKKILKSKIPFVQIVSRQEAYNRIYKKIYGYSYIHALHSSWQGVKLVDVPLLANSKKVIIMDSDLFFFNCPTEIKDWVLDKATKDNLFLPDYKHFSELSFSECLINSKIKRIKTPFNSGVLCFQRNIYSVELIDSILKTIQNTLFERMRYDDASQWLKNRHLVEQTAYMLLYSTIPSKPLGDTYAVYPKIRNIYSEIDPNKIVCIHFTGEMPRRAVYSEILRQYSPSIYFLFKNFGNVFRKMRIL